MIAVYTTSIFASAFLLFLVQPMVAKLGLPYFGGSPQVWNTCLLFFQTILLVGYAYAHLSVKWLGHRRQLALHALVLLLPLVALPPLISASSAPVPGAWPVPALLWALCVAAGLPFLTLSTNSALVQRWFALRSGREPYFLYAASNFGSLLALVAYPFVVESRLGLHAQTRWFSVGYGVFVVVSLVGMALAWRAHPVESTEAVAPKAAEPPKADAGLVSGGPVWWMLRSATTSILLIGTSLRISTDVGAVPLLWVIPLALYLVTFIIAFLDWMPYPRTVLRGIVGLLVAGTLAFPILLNSGLLYMLVPLGVLFFGCWMLHADLARDRPPASKLTSYYLWISFGGALGSVFCNLVAPVVFRTVAEYPIGLFMLAALVAVPRRLDATTMRAAVRQRTLWLALGALTFATLGWVIVSLRLPSFRFRDAIVLAILLSSLVVWRRPAVFAVAALVFGLCNLTYLRTPVQNVMLRDRSFFGTVKVVQIGRWRSLVHGSTNHGMQKFDPATNIDGPPTMYYHQTSPMGWIATHSSPSANVAVVGLGTGSIAGFMKGGQTVTYYEIDPMVEPIARKYFTFLPHCKAEIKVILGDARLSMQATAPSSYEWILVDAFSSDAIPVHLLTEEAVRLYLDKVKPGGLLVFHISNRYLDLMPVVRAHAAALGLYGAVMHHVPDDDASEDGASASDVVALAREPATLAPLAADHWDLVSLDKAQQRWTDDRSTLLGILRMTR